MNSTDVIGNATENPAFEAKCFTLMSRFLDYADWFIWLALWIAGITAVVAAIVTIINVLRGQKKENPEAGRGVADVITATRDLIDSLAKAPSWFAMFLAGVLLLWIASYAANNQCTVPPIDFGNSSDGSGNGAEADNAAAADNASAATTTNSSSQSANTSKAKKRPNPESGG
jgi:hypothetical protein